VWLFAGEPSGDLYGAELARKLRELDPELQIAGMGGLEMRSAGVDIIQDSTDLAVVGLVEVLKHYPMFRRIFNELIARAERERPDLVVFIDYPGFNLRFAKQMHKRGIACAWYVSPQVWAWGKKRIPLMAEILKEMMVIFPFETEIWENAGLPCSFVGHPLLPILRRQTAEEERDPNLVVILPGSRGSEVSRLVVPFLRTAEQLREARPELRFVLPVPHDRILPKVQALVNDVGLPNDFPLELRVGETPTWLCRASAGLAASGTVTVQAAILGLPLVVGYKVNPLSYAIWSRLVKVDHITMVNLIARKRVYEEYLQGDVCPQVLVPALERILPGGERREQVETDIRKVGEDLETGEDASANAAKAVIRMMNAQ
jgi:lipid-A-disaccharide synthase